MKGKYSKGFTLIELLVVTSIISLLSSIIFSALLPARIKSRDAERLAQINQVQKALDLYYSNNASYPSDPYTLGCDDSVPHNWQSLISTLQSQNLIGDSFLQNNFTFKDVSKEFAYIVLPSLAYAAFGPPPATYYTSPIQDPLYTSASSYSYSYGYVPAADGQSYKIRVYLENSSNPAFGSSMSGTFFTNSTTGCSACDSSLGYYCTSRG